MNEEKKSAEKASSALRYLAALAVCFLLGCGAALALRAYDGYMDVAVPLADGETIDLPAFGFALTVPDGCTLVPFEPEDGALFAGSVAIDGQSLYISCYENIESDEMSAYSDQALVSAAVRAGMQEARMRTFGGRRFLCYSVQVEQDGGAAAWHIYQTWDARMRLVIETAMPPREVLPVLLTIEFHNAGDA